MNLTDLFKGKTTIEKTIKYIEENTSYGYKDNLKDYDFINFRFRLTEEELSKVLIDFASYNIEINKLNFVLHICELLNLSMSDNKNKSIFYSIFDIYKRNLSVFPENETFDKLMSCFNDKSVIPELLNYVYSNLKLDTVEGIKLVVDNYLIKARQYYVDDRALLTSTITVIDEANVYFNLGDNKSIQELLIKKLVEDKKANGVYEIDQFVLEEFDKKASDFEALMEQLKDLVQIADNQLLAMKKLTKKCGKDITDVRIQNLKLLKTEANKVIQNFNTSYLELLNKEKESIINEKDELLSEINVEVSRKKLELEAIATQVGRRIAIELGRIKTQSNQSIEQMKDFVQNNEEVKKIFEVAAQDEAFLSAMAKLDSIQIPQTNIVIPSEVKEGITNPTGQVVMAGSPIVPVPNIIIPSEERILNEKINYYFDKTIPYKERFNELMKKKEEDIQINDSIYHEKFDDLLTIVLNNNAPYMFGPSGCGKTFMIQQQLSKLIGIDVVTNSYIMYEQDVIGYNNAYGAFTETNFYKCFKYGDMIFLDELDNSVSSSTIILNSFLGKAENYFYTFPNGARIKRNPNFRILTAGNTRGNGRTVSHNTRQKLDESVLQRLTPIEIDYDNRIEKKILTNYPDWYDFSINFRDAIKEIKIDGSDGPNYNGTVTTRDIETIRDYKDDNSFTDEKILEYEIIENKSADYLNSIVKEMENLESAGKIEEGKTLLMKFKSLVATRKH